MWRCLPVWVCSVQCSSPPSPSLPASLPHTPSTSSFALPFPKTLAPHCLPLFLLLSLPLSHFPSLSLSSPTYSPSPSLLSPCLSLCLPPHPHSILPARPGGTSAWAGSLHSPCVWLVGSGRQGRRQAASSEGGWGRRAVLATSFSPTIPISSSFFSSGSSHIPHLDYQSSIILEGRGRWGLGRGGVGAGTACGGCCL